MRNKNSRIIKPYPQLVGRFDQYDLRTDNEDGIFFARELEAVKKQAYDIKYPELKGRTLVPISYETDPGAESVRYEQYDMVGKAKVLGSYSDDPPRVDVGGKEFHLPIKAIGVSFGHSIQEIKRSRMTGKPLDARKAATARRIAEITLDDIIALGDTLTGLIGLLNQTAALTYTVPNGAGGVATWLNLTTNAPTKTADEILADLHGIARFVATSTLNSEKPDTLVLPDEHFGHIASTARSSTSDTTILEYFLRTDPHIKAVEPWSKCKGAGTNATHRMACYRRDPTALQMEIPQEFEMLPPQPKNYEIVVPCQMRVSGVNMYYPKSMAYGDGI